MKVEIDHAVARALGAACQMALEHAQQYPHDPKWAKIVTEWGAAFFFYAMQENGDIP